MRKKITVQEIKDAPKPLEMWFGGNKRIIMEIEGDSCCVKNKPCADWHDIYATVELNYAANNYKIETPKPKTTILYEYIDDHGYFVVLDSRGKFPEFKKKEFLYGSTHNKFLDRKTGREFLLNLDDWSIELVKG